MDTPVILVCNVLWYIGAYIAVWAVFILCIIQTVFKESLVMDIYWFFVQTNLDKYITIKKYSFAIETSQKNYNAYTPIWHIWFAYNHVNTLRPRQNGRHFPDDIFKCIFLNENVWITIKISLKFVPKFPINDIPALVQIMAWRRPGDKTMLQKSTCIPNLVIPLFFKYIQKKSARKGESREMYNAMCHANDNPPHSK